VFLQSWQFWWQLWQTLSTVFLKYKYCGQSSSHFPLSKNLPTGQLVHNVGEVQEEQVECHARQFPSPVMYWASGHFAKHWDPIFTWVAVSQAVQTVGEMHSVHPVGQFSQRAVPRFRYW